MYRMRPLPRSFYSRTAVEVARELIGCVLVKGESSGRIVEVEAYVGENDPAAHAARGLTPRTRVLYGPPGHAYVYFIYGMYECLNLVAEPEGSPGCVLIRAVEPLTGMEQMRRRRGLVHTEQLANGPGKLTIAMGITRELNGADVTKGPLLVTKGGKRAEIVTTTRIGIRRATDWPLRFYEKGSRFVSRK